MPHDPHAAIYDMIQAIMTAERLSAGLSEDGFMASEPIQWAVFSQIIILGEAAGRVDRSFQQDHADVPWKLIVGMRHRLVHGYDSVDWGRVWRTLTDDLPPLSQLLNGLMAVEGGEAT